VARSEDSSHNSYQEDTGETAANFEVLTIKGNYS
jgi:hypothetical protein